ncbi:Na+/H+ antiporter family protein [Lederbergia citrea]|uniref:Na+/H+ antiporter family protein n=1 Tax=Lederbergia citrea TaxID=2833581 RepID=A0A942UPX3_9BACI|nr:Na+/H+ antiporter family protein [Lederbergia citrea]MBS4205258.1 Na+/H+ antiporter family protein [Lederbergia citrea]MBS4222881.1 Na+/H+ antiporter family protein [Lederbergia citrea]
MNAVVIAVGVMLLLSLFRVNVVFALITGAFAGGLVGGLDVKDTVAAFTDGVGGGANIALSYALLGGFAVAISHTGLPKWLVDNVLKVVSKKEDSRGKALSKALIIFVILLISCFSQNLIPIHIAFIPLLIPPLLYIMNEMQIDRRLIACVLTFGLTAPYILLPVGFGQLFQQLLAENIQKSGLDVNVADIPGTLLIPVGGMVIGLLFAIFVSYRKPRRYTNASIEEEGNNTTYTMKGIIFSFLAIIVTMVAQISTSSMIFGALSGIVVLYLSGSVKWNEADSLLTQGMQMMAFIGFVMIAASGFAEVLAQTGDVESLVKSSANLIGDNKSVGALLMLIVGLLVTMGIGSSFSTIPIIATIFVPLALELGFSPLATISLVGTAAALGDAGSPASDSTLGPTAGLNADGQHNHIWDSCVPTFLHYNIPLVIFGWIAAMIL